MAFPRALSFMVLFGHAAGSTWYCPEEYCARRVYAGTGIGSFDCFRPAKTEYTTCGWEVLGDTCSCDGSVKFGNWDAWTDPAQANGSIRCSRFSFSSDPAPGMLKGCMCKPDSAVAEDSAVAAITTDATGSRTEVSCAIMHLQLTFPRAVLSQLGPAGAEILMITPLVLKNLTGETFEDFKVESMEFGAVANVSVVAHFSSGQGWLDEVSAVEADLDGLKTSTKAVFANFGQFYAMAANYIGFKQPTYAEKPEEASDATPGSTAGLFATAGLVTLALLA